MEELDRGYPAEDFARPVVDLGDELIEFYLGGVLEAGAFRAAFASLAIEVLVRAALPGGVRVGELVVERELGSVTDVTARAGSARLVTCP